MKTKKCIPDFLKCNDQIKADRKYFRGPSVLVSRTIVRSRGRGREWGTPYDSLIFYVLVFQIYDRTEISLHIKNRFEKSSKNCPKKILIEPRTPTKLSHFLIERNLG